MRSRSATVEIIAIEWFAKVLVEQNRELFELSRSVSFLLLRSVSVSLLLRRRRATAVVFGHVT